MIGLDTKVLARYFVEEAGADVATLHQRETARQLLESGQGLFLSDDNLVEAPINLIDI